MTIGAMARPTLFAALDVKAGTVLASTRRRHRSIEFRQCFEAIDAHVPADLDVHLVLDNYGTHKTPRIRRAARGSTCTSRPPTKTSWMNLVERWFAALTTKQLRRGTHRSVAALTRAIREFIAVTNDAPKPFVWTKPCRRDSREHRAVRPAHVGGPSGLRMFRESLLQDTRRPWPL